MSKDGNKKIIIMASSAFFLLLYAIVVIYTIGSIGSEKGKNRSLQNKLTEAISARQESEIKLKEADIVTADLKTRLKSQEDAIAASAQSLDAVKAENNQNLLKLKSRENDIGAIQAKLNAAKAEADSLRSKFEAVNNDYLDLKAKFDAIQKAKEDAEAKAKETSEHEGTSLGTIVVAK